MEGTGKPVILSTKDKLKAKIRRRWNKKLTKKESEKYAHHIEEELCEEAIVEEEAEAKRDGCSLCRERGREILHSKHVLRLIVALCIIDCLMVMVELILDNAAVRNDIVDKYGLRGGGCADQSNKTDTAHHRRRRASGGGDHGEHSVYADIAHYCHYVSVSILCFLTLETLIKIFCFGKRFFRSKLEVFDAFVVIASLIADCILLDGVTNDPPLLSSAIVNLLLPWRIIRVVNSLVIATKDHEHFKLLLVYKSKKQVEDQLDICLKELQASRNHVKILSENCKEAGLHTEEFGIENGDSHSKKSIDSKESTDSKASTDSKEVLVRAKTDDVTVTFHDDKLDDTEKPPRDDSITHL